MHYYLFTYVSLDFQIDNSTGEIFATAKSISKLRIEKKQIIRKNTYK